MNPKSFNIAKLNKAIKTSEFEKMKKLENENEFRESVMDPRTRKKKSFFRLGPKNNWREHLDKKNIDKIEKTFHKEMLELGYL